MLFSLISLNSLHSIYSLLLGIVFDTREGDGLFQRRVGYRFRYPQERRITLCWFFCSLSTAGYRFRYPRERRIALCWFFLLPFYAGYRFRYPQERRVTLCCFFCSLFMLGIVFDTREGEGLPFVGFLLPFYCWVSFSIPVKVWAIVGLIKVIASQSNLRGDKNLQIVDFIMVLQDYYL